MWTIFYVASISIPTLYEMICGVDHEMNSTPYPTAHEFNRTEKKNDKRNKSINISINK